ncbi:MAG: Rrf2 family transcriptional regulator [Alphaproteobacteria bacterium]|nr:Rrf2 family transcriptional regulator [Alphaproteobacteria bacterium]
MITLSKKIFYAVEAVLYIAYNAAGGAISSRDIAERQGLPPRYLEQLMQRLVRGGILRGMRGPRGGYVLARERRRITIGDICQVLQDEKDDDAGGYAGTPLGNKVVLPVWESAYKQMLEHLKQVSLAELCEHATEKNIRKVAEERLDFII